jgi:hypothetical protein
MHRRGADGLADERLGRRTVRRDIQAVKPVGRSAVTVHGILLKPHAARK